MADKSSTKKNISTRRLMLLITIVSRRKAEFFMDLIHSQGANMQFVTMGEGTADEKLLRMLELGSSDKAIIFSVMPEEKANETLELIDERFHTIRNGKGVAFTVPFSSVIGATVFNFLADNRMTLGR